MITDAFAVARQAWLDAPMPHGSATDDVDELKADLAYWDYVVAETVLPYADDGVWTEAPVDVRHGIADLRKRVHERARSASGRDVELLHKYDSYAGLLADVYTEAERHAEKRPRP
jgi:hypothetical protein